MQGQQPWMACVRVNRHDKAYFLHQLDGFVRTTPLLVTWDDARPVTEDKGPTAVLATPWARVWRFPGGHRLGQIWDRLRAKVVAHPLSASAAEMGLLETLSQTHPPSAIYAHTGFVGVRLLALKEKLDVPLVVHFHGLDITSTDPIYRAELARALPHFDRVIVVGHWMVARLVALGCDAGVISVIPMGAVTSGIAPVTRTHGPVRFIAVGRLVGVKGLDRTIAAFAKVQQANPDTELHLVGDGPLRSMLETQTRDLGLEDTVVFHGQMPSEDALTQVAHADVFVHHALDEPGGPEAFGVVITEAMARGLPVVGTICGGLPDQIVEGETGLLVAQNDVDAMAEAMTRLAADPALRSEMGDRGRTRATTLFDAHALARQAEDLLDEVGKG